MSKRKSKPVPKKMSHGELLGRFNNANETLVPVNVSIPVLNILNRLISDQKFRQGVFDLLKK